MKADEKLREYAKAFASESATRFVQGLMALMMGPAPASAVDKAERGVLFVRALEREFWGAFLAGGWAGMRFAGVYPDHEVQIDGPYLARKWDEFLDQREGELSNG